MSDHSTTIVDADAALTILGYATQLQTEYRNKFLPISWTVINTDRP